MALQHQENARRNAHAAYTHAYRVKRLEEQTAAWHEAKRLAEYVTAVRERATPLTPGPERTEIKEWLTFAEAHLQELIATATTPTLPTPPTPSSADLAPLLAQKAFANHTSPRSQMRP
ncbi:hypothetical protein [Streptomyces sp. SCSIO ZS0520]|uniref:hypothetical protein n=1 Tax=Streptomyces sp. SCSIO ZS0520 TaxID=2892996 RepID=UPI0021DAC3BD|nr:hypothetical protein [Streptomyces sp. SCSIO ZS0520]